MNILWIRQLLEVLPLLSVLFQAVYSHIGIFNEMHKTTLAAHLYSATRAMQFHPSQQKCSLLQAISKHAKFKFIIISHDSV